MRVAVGELRLLVVPAHLELPLLDVMVEPGAPEDELLQPVDERFALDEGDLVPAANEIAAERAPGVLDRVPLDELDQVGRLVVVELVPARRPSLTAAAVTRCSKSSALKLKRKPRNSTR